MSNKCVSPTFAADEGQAATEISGEKVVSLKNRINQSALSDKMRCMLQLSDKKFN